MLGRVAQVSISLRLTQFCHYSLVNSGNSKCYRLHDIILNYISESLLETHGTLDLSRTFQIDTEVQPLITTTCYLNPILVQGPVSLEQPAFPLLPPQGVIGPVLRSL